MDWLSAAGALSLLWLVVVFLVTPGINYHLSRRTSVHADDFLYTLQWTCQAALHHGNQVTVFSNRAEFYPAMLEAIRSASALRPYRDPVFLPDRALRRALVQPAGRGVAGT